MAAKISTSKLSARATKRSRGIRLAAMGVAGVVVLSGCDNSTRSPDTPVFTDVAQCVSSGEYTEQECETGLRFAMQQQAADGSQQFRTRDECGQVYSANQCHSYPRPGGGNIWMGLLGGYMLGQMIDGRRDYHYYNYGGHWSSYDSRSGRINRSYRTPANLPRPARAVIPKPTRAHTAAITRGGFGSSARSSWGG